MYTTAGAVIIGPGDRTHPHPLCIPAEFNQAGHQPDRRKEKKS